MHPVLIARCVSTVSQLCVSRLCSATVCLMRLSECRKCVYDIRVSPMPCLADMRLCLHVPHAFYQYFAFASLSMHLACVSLWISCLSDECVSAAYFVCVSDLCLMHVLGTSR